MEHKPDRSLPVPAPSRPLQATLPIHAPTTDTAVGGMGDVVHALRRGFGRIVLSVVLVTAAVVGYTLLLPTEYAAQSIVLVEPESVPFAVGPPGQATVTGGLRRDLSREMGRLQHSAQLRYRVAERLLAVANTVDEDRFFPMLVEDGRRADVATVAERLSRQVSFTPLMDQAMITIRATSTVPEEAARIANVYAEEYRQSSREASRASLAAARSFLEGQVERLGAELAEVDEQRVAVGLGRPVEEAAGISYRARYDDARLRLMQEQYALEVIDRELDRIGPVQAPRQAPPGLEAEIAAYDQRIAELKLRAEVHYAANPDLLGNEHRVPELAELNRSIAHFEARKAERVQQLAAALGPPQQDQSGYAATLQAQRIQRDAAVRGLTAEVAALAGRAQGETAQLAGAPRQAVAVEQVERRRGLLASWHDAYLQQLQQTLVAEEAELGYVSVVASAGLPRKPVSPNLPQNTVLGLLLGLGLGVGLALAQHASNARMRHPEELEARGFAVLGVVPGMEKRIKRLFAGGETAQIDGQAVSTRLVTLIDPWSPHTEHYRLIRTNLAHLGTGPLPGVLLVTSPDVGAGKTVTASNLAVALAQGGREVVLIDADLRRPRLHSMFGTDGSIGLADMLERPEDWLDMHRSAWHLPPFATRVPNLSLIPAGNPSIPPSELLEAKAFLALLDVLRAEFDVVVLDSPPVLVTTDALLLAQLADATMMVVAAEQTDRRSLERARRLLNSVGVDIAGTVLNKADERDGATYGYGPAARYYTTHA